LFWANRLLPSTLAAAVEDTLALVLGIGKGNDVEHEQCRERRNG